jgi:hypothetical protein
LRGEGVISIKQVIERGNELQDKTTMRDRKAVQPNAAEISMQRDAVVEDKLHGHIYKLAAKLLSAHARLHRRLRTEIVSPAHCLMTLMLVIRWCNFGI